MKRPLGTTAFHYSVSGRVFQEAVGTGRACSWNCRLYKRGLSSIHLPIRSGFNLARERLCRVISIDSKNWLPTGKAMISGGQYRSVNLNLLPSQDLTNNLITIAQTQDQLRRMVVREQGSESLQCNLEGYLYGFYQIFRDWLSGSSVHGRL